MGFRALCEDEPEEGFGLHPLKITGHLEDTLAHSFAYCMATHIHGASSLHLCIVCHVEHRRDMNTAADTAAGSTP